jgi:hypothetical protein
MTPPTFSPRRGDSILVLVSLLGALDVASFLRSRWRSLFRASSGRALGSIVGLLLWSGLAACALAERSSRRHRPRSAITTCLAAVCGLGNLSLMVIHLKVGKGRARAIVGGMLGALAGGAAVDRLLRP